MLLRSGLRGGGLALLALAGLAACGSDRIVLELQGAAPGAKRVDVTLLEPAVLAKVQRRADRGGPVTANQAERVFYMAQRSTVGFTLDGAAIDGLQFEVADSGGAYVPLVVARDDQGVLAMGIYNPGSVFSAEVGSEFRPDAVEPVGDVTIYPIQLEPVKGLEASPAMPTPVMKGEVMVVRCKPNGPVSGAVWRRSDDKQLRLLLPLSDSPSAVDRLDAPDLDCDDHSPGPVGLEARSDGDKLDCDDTAFVVHAKQAEACSTFDEDCNPATTFSQRPCTCGTTGGVCACEDPGINHCPELTDSQKCDVPSKASGPGRTPCESRGDLLALPGCALGCTVTLVSVPDGWDVRIGPDRGVGESFMLPSSVKIPIAVRATTPANTASNVAFLSVRPTGMMPAIHGVRLVLSGTNDMCEAMGQITCAAQ